MRPEVAHRRIEAFGKRFGEAHLYLAYHAAFPLALTPDLLYRLWANFQRDIHGEALNIPWIAVADLLLSSLCDEVGHELYEMEGAVRNALLSQFKVSPRFGTERINELSDFLLAYVRQQLDSPDMDTRDFAQAQRWTALAYTKPTQAARELALTLSTLNIEDRAEWVRMASVVETFAEPLAEFEPLLVYARGMESFARGDQKGATLQMVRVLGQDSKVYVVGVNMPVPKPIFEAARKVQKQYLSERQNYSSPDLLRNLYNAFDPFRPLPAGDPNYVDCREVRGDGDILEDLGIRLQRSNQKTCQLYSGHRGAGKSTELLRLKKSLEEQKFYVVYFAADEEDIELEDAQYTDILLACTHHLLEDLQKSADTSPLRNWLKSRWQELKDLALTEISFEGLSVEGQISQFAKLTANLRAEPTLRHKIREKVNPHIFSLISVLNEFLAEAKRKLPNGCTKLAVIVDHLDRIAPIIQDNGQTNHDEIFLDRSEQLKALDCHLIYTIPISMVFSKRAADLRDIYSDTQVLPMVMVRTPTGDVYQPGLEKIKEVICRRVKHVAPELSFDTEVFDSPETLNQLCLMSGGHMRNLLLLTQDSIGRSAELPISKRAVQRAMTQARSTYHRTVNHDQWELLAEISRTKRVVNDDKYRSLLFNRCILEYRYLDDEGEVKRWCDVHPLITDIQEFKEAVAETSS